MEETKIPIGISNDNIVYLPKRDKHQRIVVVGAVRMGMSSCVLNYQKIWGK